MENQTLFTEQQKFKQWWVWLIIIGINGVFLYAVYQQIFRGEAFGDKPMSDLGLLIGTVVALSSTLLFINFRLETQIKSDGIYVRFFPFHIVFKYYPWDKISKIYFRKYSPMRDYGGWGIRHSLFGKGKAYNISGNRGLQLEFTDSKKLLIGTNKEKELKEILQNMGKMK